MEPSWKKPSGYYPGELPNLTRQAFIQIQDIQRTPQRYSSRKATSKHSKHNCQIHQDCSEEKHVKGSQRERSGYPQRETIRLTEDLSAEILQAGREWGPIFNIL